jgi:hypothetical protein
MEQKEKILSPYMAGALAGLLIVFSVWFTGNYIGASTTYVRAAGYIEKEFNEARMAQKEYYKKHVPKIDWQFLFVAGIFVGALISSTTSRSFRWQAVPSRWADYRGPVIFDRALAAFAGGAVAMFGARLADGCPSGNGLSGSLQMAVSGWIALVCFFIGGVVMARLLYRWGADHE